MSAGYTAPTGFNPALSLNRCRGKVRYTSKRIASGHLRVLRKMPNVQHPDYLQVYGCASCGSWHIGHGWRKQT